jgi:hypothetical protein
VFETEFRLQTDNMKSKNKINIILFQNILIRNRTATCTVEASETENCEVGFEVWFEIQTDYVIRNFKLITLRNIENCLLYFLIDKSIILH